MKSKLLKRIRKDYHIKITFKQKTNDTDIPVFYIYTYAHKYNKNKFGKATSFLELLSFILGDFISGTILNAHQSVFKKRKWKRTINEIQNNEPKRTN